MTAKTPSKSDAMAAAEEDVIEEYRCGLFGWRPEWLQSFNTAPWLLVTLTAAVGIEVSPSDRMVKVGMAPLLEYQSQGIGGSISGKLGRCIAVSYTTMFPTLKIDITFKHSGSTPILF